MNFKQWREAFENSPKLVGNKYAFDPEHRKQLQDYEHKFQLDAHVVEKLKTDFSQALDSLKGHLFRPVEQHESILKALNGAVKQFEGLEVYSHGQTPDGELLSFEVYKLENYRWHPVGNCKIHVWVTGFKRRFNQQYNQTTDEGTSQIMKYTIDARPPARDNDDYTRSRYESDLAHRSRYGNRLY